MALNFAKDLRDLVNLFPRDLALHRVFLLQVADELERLHAFTLSQAGRIAAQSELLAKRAARPEGLEKVLINLIRSGGTGWDGSTGCATCEETLKFLSRVFKDSK